MCIKCEAKKTALSLMGMELKRTVIGKVESGLILNLNLADNELDKIKADLHAEIAVLIMKGLSKVEAQEQLESKYEKPFNAAVDKAKNCWKEIEKALGVDGLDDDISIDILTGELYKEKVIPAAAVQGVH
ncbi:hypothetical protein [Cytobacillus horneckiae]|uniref:hypothetical protein n=1 Tax=Cytobacillus horneckiae TaxID=549687 RepID=UPI003D9AA417